MNRQTRTKPDASPVAKPAATRTLCANAPVCPPEYGPCPIDCFYFTPRPADKPRHEG